MKPCSKCGGVVEPRHALHRLPCRACQTAACSESRRKNPGPYKASMLKWRAAHPEKAKRSARMGMWKIKGIRISWEEYTAMLIAQSGRCAICLAPEERVASLHLDHDHSSGHVRGLLCLTCNAALGYMKDDPQLLLAAAQYLEAHQPKLQLVGRK